MAAVETARCGDASGNSGFKIQGDATGGPVTHINVASIIATDQTGPGLFMDGSVDCTVWSFHGEGNNRNGDRGDVWIGGIATRSIASAAHAVAASGSSSATTRRTTRSMKSRSSPPGAARRATGTAGVHVFGGTGRFGDIVCVDRSSKLRMSRAVDVSSPSAIGSIDSLTVLGQDIEPFKSNSPQFARPRTSSR